MRRGFAPWTDPNAVPVVRFKGVSKRFANIVGGERLVVDFYVGEFFALVGP